MAVAARENLASLRAEVQRKFATQIDLGTPDPPPPEPVAPPKVERRRVEILRAEAQKNSTVRPERRSLGSFFAGARGGWRLRPTRLALVLVALLAGGLAAFLATQHEQPGAQPFAQPVAAAEPEVRTQILVAKQTVAVGQRLSPAALAWEDWPAAAVRPEYITIAAAPAAITDLAGSVARFVLFAGEPIRQEKLAPADTSYLSTILGKGMRAVSVSIAAESASGGFISPNDRVDILLTRTSGPGHDAEMILRNVRVLAINARLGATSANPAPGGSGESTDAFSGQGIATLELDPMAAQVITDAVTIGKLSLVLRSSADAVEPGTAEERAVNAAIRLSSPFWVAGTGNAPQRPPN